MNPAVPGTRPAFFRVEQIMGMPIVIDVRDADLDPAALDRAFDWFRFVDVLFSTYKADSEISRLNRGELRREDVHPEVRAVLARCEELREETAGSFDIRAPALAAESSTSPGQAPEGTITRPQSPVRCHDTAVSGRGHSRRPESGERALAVTTEAVDPSGLVKGWSVGRAAQILEAAGARNYCINAGGDIVTRGCPFPALYWRIGIQHPLQRDQLAGVVAVRDRAIATSGAYERGDHIVDPHTSRPPADVLSVTIVGPDLATADAYATAAFAMGRAGPAWTARLAGYEAMTILADQTVLKTMGFPSV
jgi:thiamine biosynthesis lipoprotein